MNRTFKSSSHTLWLAAVACTACVAGPVDTIVPVRSAAQDRASHEDTSIQTVIRKHETAALEAFRTHDKAAYRSLCLGSFYEITSDGSINTLQDELQELDDYVLGDYTMEDVVVTVVSDSIALIRYKIRAQYSFRGKPLPIDTILASAVWVRRGAAWKAATYQEVKVRGAS